MMRKLIFPALCLVASQSYAAPTMQELWSNPSHPIAAGVPATVASASVIAAGSAPIEQALARLIPAPYRIQLDARVPVSWIVSWPSGTDWMAVLRAALTPMGLVVVPHWDANTIQIVLAQAETPGTSTMPVATTQTMSIAQAAPVTTQPAMRVQTLPSEVLSGTSDASWQDHIAPPAHPVAFDAAVLQILPAKYVNARVDMTGVDTSQKVSWQAGTRAEAMRSVLRQVGASATIAPDVVRITSAHAAKVAGKEKEQAALVSGNVRPEMPARVAVAPVFGLNLMAGKPLGEQMREQGKAQGWTVVWNVTKDWVVPSPTAFGGDFQSAATQAIEAAASEGAPIAARIYSANRTIVVEQTGVTNH